MFSRDADVLRLFQAGELSSPTVSFWGTRGKWLPALPLSVCLCASTLWQDVSVNTVVSLDKASGLTSCVVLVANSTSELEL